MYGKFSLPIKIKVKALDFNQTQVRYIKRASDKDYYSPPFYSDQILIPSISGQLLNRPGIDVKASGRPTAAVTIW